MVFSILIPVYNVEKYLRQCLESVLIQDFSDYEIILVNDGSTDSSASICREYAQRDARIKYYEKENEGLLQTRRYLIRRASGDYLLFLDSDDFWEPGILSILYGEISRRDIDLIVYCYRTITDSGKKLFENKGLFPDRTVFTENNKEPFMKEFASTRLNNLWIKCVRRTIVDVDADYRIFGDIKGEDLLQSIPMVRNASTILYLDELLVNYRQSTSGRGRNFKKYYLDDYKKVRNILKDSLVQMNCSDEVMRCFYSRYLEGLMAFMDPIATYSENAQTFRETCDYFRAFLLYREAQKVVASSSIKSRKLRMDYILLENNKYFFLYYLHRITSTIRKKIMSS